MCRSFGGSGVGEHAERLVAVRGDDDVIKCLRRVGAGLDSHGVLGSSNGAHGRTQVNGGAAFLDERLDVVSRTALDDAPCRLLEETEQAMVLHEAQERNGGHLAHVGSIGGPNGGKHGDDVAIAHGGADFSRVEDFAEVAGSMSIAEYFLRVLVEAGDVAKHPPMILIRDSARLRENPAKTWSGVLEAGDVVHEPEAHVGRLPLDAESIDQAAEVGIRAIVKDDKTGVDGEFRGSLVDIDRVGVSAEIVVGFEQMHFGHVAQLIGSDQSGNSGSNNSDTHSKSLELT